MSVRSIVKGPRGDIVAPLGPAGETGRMGPNGAPIVRTRRGTERELIMGPPRQTAIERAGGTERPRISVMIVDQMGIACPACGAPAREWCRPKSDGSVYSNGRPVMCAARKDEAIRVSMAECHELPR